MSSNTSPKRVIGVIILVLLIIAAIVLVVINPFEELISKQTPGGKEPTQETAVSVAVEILELQNMQNVIRGNGNVIDPTSIDIYPEVAGTLTQLLVKVGERVEKDQVLGTVNPSRAGMVYKENVITAPSSGTVLMLPFTQGAIVTMQTPIARLGLFDDLEVIMTIAERHVGEVVIGTQARLKFKAFPGETFTGTVSRLSPVLNPATRTLEIGITVDDPEHKIKSGMFPTVELLTKHLEGVLAISRSALLYAGAQPYVFIVDASGLAQRRNIEIGLQASNLVQVVSGLERGERLVVQGQSLLTDGAAVHIVE